MGVRVGGKCDHALPGFSGDKKHRVLRCGADVMADPATGAHFRIHAGLSLLNDDGSLGGTAFGTDRTEGSAPREAKAVKDERKGRRFFDGIR